MKTCTRCREEKPTTEFNKNRRWEDGLNRYCRDCANDVRRASDAKHRDKRRATVRAGYYRRKMEVINHYGGKCACCGESEPAFLQIDHIDDDGATHRASLPHSGAAGVIYRWLKQNGWPEGFQVLCANCNMAKSSRAGCPHQIRTLSAAEIARLA